MASWALVLLSGVWGDETLTDARVMQPMMQGKSGTLASPYLTLPRLGWFDARDARQKAIPISIWAALSGWYKHRRSWPIYTAMKS
jgi:hypothetical protein